MKKIISVLTLLTFFIISIPSAKAQLTVFNLTNCDFKIAGSYNYASVPCAGRQCQTGTFYLAPNSTFTIPGIGTCISPSFPPPAANFVELTVVPSSFPLTTVSLCGTASAKIKDCQGNTRLVHIFNYHFAAIY